MKLSQAEQYETDVRANPTRLIRFAEWLEAKCDRLEADNAEILEEMKRFYIDPEFSDSAAYKIKSIIDRHAAKEEK